MAAVRYRNERANGGRFEFRWHIAGGGAGRCKQANSAVINGCAYAGSRAVAGAPVAAFAAFYLADRQQVALRIHDEHTRRLTGDAQVFLFNATGQVVAQYGAGLTPILPD
jgi:hypothetical protein